MMSRRISIGRYVHARRIKAGLTFRELSKLTGLTATLIFAIENGKTDPKLSYLEKLAAGFGETPQEFLKRYYSPKKR